MATFLEGWTYDKLAGCITCGERIPIVDTEEMDFLYFQETEIFVVDTICYSDDVEVWKDAQRQKYFIRTFDRAVEFAKGFVEGYEEERKVIGIRPISSDEYNNFENLYAHFFYEHNWEEGIILSNSEVTALPDPDYPVRVD